MIEIREQKLLTDLKIKANLLVDLEGQEEEQSRQLFEILEFCIFLKNIKIIVPELVEAIKWFANLYHFSDLKIAFHL